MGSAHLISVGQIEGGVLSRSFEDLHPTPDAYTVIWNGTIAAQDQRAEQRPAPGTTAAAVFEKVAA